MAGKTDTWPVGAGAPSPAQRARHYKERATSDNTRDAYRSDIRHFEEEWGGLLPCSRQKVVEYLASYAGKLSVATLSRRVAALAAWHRAAGFADPTRNESVRKVMTGIRKEHNAPQRQARALTLDELSQLAGYLHNRIDSAATTGLVTGRLEQQWLMAHRDLAILLIGFWRGFRADTICKLKLEHIKESTMAIGGNRVKALQIFLPASKGDRKALGETYKLPARPELCPVLAYENWVSAADIGNQKGWVFRKFDKEGNLTANKLLPGSLNHWMKRLCKAAGISQADEFSSHSMRRGVATLLADKGGDVPLLKEYIGWRSDASAIRYVSDSRCKGDELLLQ